ncbi:MAG: hypothetical protein ACREB9_02825 [Thermoplasmata archaeon]
MSPQHQPGLYAASLGPDADAGDLIASITAAYNGTTATLFPLLYEGIGPALVPPVGFIVVAPFNFHLGLDWINFDNPTSAAVDVFIQKYEFGTEAAPFGVAGPIVFSHAVAAGTSYPVDMSRFRISCEPGFFLAVGATGSAISAGTAVVVQSRARPTPG